MSRPRLEVADVFRRHGPAYRRAHRLSGEQHRVMRAIERCRTAAQTLETTAADPKHLGAQIGFLAVLHTWGQNLLPHPHLHCLAPGGGLAPDGARWIACRPGFFLPVRVLSRLFRRLFLEGLEALFRRGRLSLAGPLKRLADPDAFARLLAQLRAVEWVVYAKPPPYNDSS